MKKIIVTFSLFSILQGCFLIPEKSEMVEKFRNQSNMKLCMDYLSRDDYWTNVRLEVLEERSENCSDYAAAASAKAQNKAAERDITVNVNSRPQPVYYVPSGLRTNP